MSGFTNATLSNMLSRKRGHEDEEEFARKRAANKDHRVGRQLQEGKFDQFRDTTVFKVCTYLNWELTYPD
jgi:hypothetical protein